MLQPKLSELHMARMQREALEDDLVDAKVALQMTPEAQRVKALQEQVAAMDASLKLMRDAIVQEALIVYRNNPLDKHPCAGIAVKVEKVLEYDTTLAEAWCQQHYTLAFDLNTKAFEQQIRLLAKNDTGETKRVPTFVKITEQPVITIATNLAPHIILTPPAEEV